MSTRTILIVVGAVLLATPLLIFEHHRFPSGSMLPTIPIGARLVSWRFGSSCSLGDLIVFEYPQERSKRFVKRIVGLGGDTIAIEDNAIVRNGARIPRRQLHEQCSYLDAEEGGAPGEQRACVAFEERLGRHTYRVIQDRNAMPSSRKPVRVPPGHVFVVGDNRDNSHDSRFWGTVPGDHDAGRVIWIWR